LLPEGIEEILPDEAARLERLRRDVLDLFGTWGYRLVVTPLIEFIESLLTGAGHDLDIQTFKLIDQISGRQMGVRADMTPQVARIDARYSEAEVPSRLCYLGTVLHTQSDHLEKSRSPMQVGAELYGHAGIASDLEIMSLMLDMLAVGGVQNVHLDLGHVGIYRGLAEQTGLDACAEGQLFEILQRKAKPELAELLSGTGIAPAALAWFAALMDLNGGAEVIGEARRRLAGADGRVHAAIDELEAIASALLAKFPSLPIHFDLAELRGYHYHTGMVFAAFVPGYGRDIARGGRYDDIGRVFGRARPATGFSADLRVLLRFCSVGLGKEDPLGPILAPAVDDVELQETVRQLRAAGHTVVQELAGQLGEPMAMGCQQRLDRVEGAWRLIPLGS
jgi:ATP phosphoribosyltransferase regulatory subunit